MNSPEAYNHNSFLLSALHQFSHSIFTSPSAKCWYYSHYSDEDTQGSERLNNLFRFTGKVSDRSGVSSGKMESIHGACNLHLQPRIISALRYSMGSLSQPLFFFFLTLDFFCQGVRTAWKIWKSVAIPKCPSEMDLGVEISLELKLDREQELFEIIYFLWSYIFIKDSLLSIRFYYYLWITDGYYQGTLKG